MAADQGSQAHRNHVPHGRDLCVLPGRSLRHDDSSRTGHSGRGSRLLRHLQQDVHHARRRHGVLRVDPGRARHPRKLRAAVDARREGRRLPEAEPSELVHLRHRVSVHRLCDGVRRRRHWLDLLHALQQPRIEHQRGCDRAWSVHHRFLVDSHRSELHGDHPSDARAGAYLVPVAALRVGDLLDEPRADPRHPGHCHHHAGARR